MSIREEPASLAHVLVMMDGPPGLRLPLLKTTYRMIGAQMAASDAFALFDGDSEIPFAIIGGAYLPAGGMEAWFLVRPGGLRSDLLLRLVRLARTKLEASGMRAIAFVHIGNKAGERLSRLIGFYPGEACIAGAMEWRREAWAKL